MLYTVNDCLPMSCLKYHDCLWKVSLIKLDTVWLGKKSLENLEPDDVIEKRNPFSEEKFKLAAEICISNEEPNVNHQDYGENVSRACQRRL